MDRRRFMQAAAAATGSVGLAGCLGAGDGTESEPGDREGPQRYTLPAYSELTPAESHAGGGVVVVHIELAMFEAVQQAAAAGRLPDGPLVDLPLRSLETVPDAVETLSSYPFAATLREAVNDGAGRQNGDATGNVTVVDPGNETLFATTNESLEANTTDESLGADATNESLDGNTTSGAGNETVGTRSDSETSSGTGINVTELTLTDELLVFHGSYDPAVIGERYTQGFERVDQQRGIDLYEGRNDQSGLGFGVGDEMLIVPTERSDREAAAETVLAHTVSGFVNTLDRVIDDENGQWLFETTGPAPFSLGVWGTDEPLELIAEQRETPTTSPDGSDPVFGAVEEFITALEPAVDDTTGEVTELSGRFAGLFPDGPPTEEQLRTSLASEATSNEVFRDEPRGHVTAAFELN